MIAAINRRAFVTTLGGAAAALARPRAACAQQATTPVIGLLLIGAPTAYDLSGFRQGLKDAGYVEGQNLTIDYRWANDDPERLPPLAAELVHREVRVIVTLASTLAALAAKAATDTIPIVFGFGGDPVQEGVVASLNRPGGNITGMTSLSAALIGKQLGILHELLPQADRVGVLSNPKIASHARYVQDSQAAAAAIGESVEILTASSGDEIDAALTNLADAKRIQGLLVSNDPFYLARRVQLAILAARLALPTIYPFPEQAEAGGLLSYGPDLSDRDREVGHYVARILAGEKPADLPVQQQSKFELVINVQTAKTLGLAISPLLLARADEVIE
jgi:putative tryptophan/tyrosine transport system substrate-binding protein